jgi:hypothetical protein
MLHVGGITQRSQQWSPALHAQVLETVCCEVQKQARLYQESIRDVSELEDTTGVELLQGRTAGKARSMVAIKKEKIDRSKNFARVMQEVTMLRSFIRLADYLFIEGVIARVVVTTEDLLTLLQAQRQQQVGRPQQHPSTVAGFCVQLRRAVVFMTAVALQMSCQYAVVCSLHWNMGAALTDRCGKSYQHSCTQRNHPCVVQLSNACMRHRKNRSTPTPTCCPNMPGVCWSLLAHSWGNVHTALAA